MIPESSPAPSIIRPQADWSALRFFTKRGTATALIIGGVLNLLASVLIQFWLDAAGGERSVALVENPGLGLVATSLNLLAIPLMLLGFGGLLRLASRRAPVLSRVAWGASIVGLGAFFVMTASVLVLYSVAAESSPEIPAPVLAAINGQSGSWVFLGVFALFMIVNPLGIILSAVAFLRSRIIPLWATLSLLAFLIADFVLPPLPFIDWHVLFLAFAGGTAWAVLKTGEECWADAGELG
ncbi:hypothetical protein [Paeniglutamicibacter cryotolerans]|uniref:DUF4386 family protein n=1 Tax=Paeniglutamicibacter cryotolerans TaxID=670079 RepID=A0A839QG77_9MICC|nr:hypothetical protein [Paeniglutamicibacter cryotolerans]MBB2994890.1 hypothetical protein [Paeniglutamicibacter cryotolerans]